MVWAWGGVSRRWGVCVARSHRVHEAMQQLELHDARLLAWDFRYWQRSLPHHLAQPCGGRLRDIGAAAGVAFVQAMESVCPGEPEAAFSQLLKQQKALHPERD